MTQTGCLSHEYVIHKDELARLANEPPERRGMRVRAVQDLGIRRGPALDPEAPPPGPPAEGGAVYTDRGVVHDDPHWHGHVYIGGVVHPGYHRRHFAGRGYGRGYRGSDAPAIAKPAGPETTVTPTAAVGPTAAAPAATPAPTAPANAAPAAAAAASKGSSNADDLMVYAVVAIALASVAVVGAGLTEGLRFDGDVSVAPDQLIYLQDERGAERALPIAALTANDLAGAERAILRDDEGYGLVRVERGPLNRKGFTFKVDVGSLSTRVGADRPLGLASDIQFGYFPWSRAGFLLGVSLAGAKGEGAFARHSARLEAQAFPLSLWRFHLGGAVHGGTAVVPEASGVGEVWGVPIFGAGALLEIELTTRLALTGRFDWSVARNGPNHWSTARSILGGLAVY